MSLTSKQRRRRQREDARVRSAETAAYARARRKLERVVRLPPSTQNVPDMIRIMSELIQALDAKLGFTRRA